MRRMRDLVGWQGWIVVFSIGLIAWGGMIVVKKKRLAKAQNEWAAVDQSQTQAPGKIPTGKGSKNSAKNKKNSTEAEIAAAVTGTPDSLDTMTEKVAQVSGVVGTSGSALPGDDVCTSAEYRGNSYKMVDFGKKDWAKFKDVYHAAKKDLISWLGKNKSYFDEKVYKTLEAQIMDIRIQKSPATEAPDLAWRGIGVFTQDASHHPLVRLGGGFKDLAKRDPKRARFELTRLLAQSWSPCEIKKVSGVEGTWDPLLQCLEVVEYLPCSESTFSESGWAVSTAVAAQVAPINCKIPAFKDERIGKCLKTFGRDIASVKEKKS